MILMVCSDKQFHCTKRSTLDFCLDNNALQLQSLCTYVVSTKKFTPLLIVRSDSTGWYSGLFSTPAAERDCANAYLDLAGKVQSNTNLPACWDVCTYEDFVYNSFKSKGLWCRSRNTTYGKVTGLHHVIYDVKRTNLQRHYPACFFALAPKPKESLFRGGLGTRRHIISAAHGSFSTNCNSQSNHENGQALCGKY